MAIAILEHVTSVLCHHNHVEYFDVTDDTKAPEKTPENEPKLPENEQKLPEKNIPTPQKDENTDTQLTEELKKHIAPQARQAEQENVTNVVKIPKGTGTKDIIESTGDRANNDLIKSDMPYTDYHHLPLGDYYKPTDFEYGYSFLPPEKWYPEPPFPPVCVTEKRCPVCPAYTTGTPVDVKEWMASSRITPPDRINTEYIKEKLNSGR